MKKKFVAIIAAGTVSLLLGGLVYCGISAFPELLEEDAENENIAEVKNAVKDHQKTFVVDDFETESSLDNDSPIVASVSETKSAVEPINDNNFEGFVSVESFHQIKEIIVSTGLSHFIDETQITEILSFVEVPEVFEEENISQTSYVSHHVEEIKIVEPAVKAKAVKSKAVSNADKSASSKATIECSLLVIGAVDLISMLLVRHKKRHLLR